jgi:hypothetical protein
MSEEDFLFCARQHDILRKNEREKVQKFLVICWTQSSTHKFCHAERSAQK